MKILVTGGLGYIGSHISYLLKDKAVIIDNKCNSSLNYKKYLPKASVYVKDLNIKSLRYIFLKHKIGSVIHLASHKAVNESLRDPIKYYENNIISSIQLLKTMNEFNVNKLIFSSSATVYGNKYSSPLVEELEMKSTSPYGSTKIFIENIINEYAISNNKFKAISLRYFNPIGSNIKANLFDKPLGKPLNLMPILIDTVKKNKTLNIFGDDYDTPDGTCVRDFIHVSDLANAHFLALKKLSNLKGHTAINIGLGKGISVKEILKIFEEANNVYVKSKVVKRRQGDSAVVYADNKKALKILGWKPKFDYRDMVKNAWQETISKKNDYL